MDNETPSVLITWLEETSLLSIVLWIAALTTIIGVAIRTISKAIPALKSIISLSESLQKLPAWMAEVDVKLEQVRHEVLPNSGGSMRDDVQTVSLQIEKLQAHQDNDLARLDALELTINRRLTRREQTRTGEIETQGDD